MASLYFHRTLTIFIKSQELLWNPTDFDMESNIFQLNLYYFHGIIKIALNLKDLNRISLILCNH